MCVAFAVPDGVPFPTLNELESMEKFNDDGAGLAWFDEGEVHWLKGLDASEIHTLGSQISGPKLGHFRMCTAGPSIPELTHPFPVEKAPRTSLSGRAKRVMIHNGHISDWEFYKTLMAPLPGGPWTDTRLVARMMAMHGDDILEEFWGQKFITLDNSGQIHLFGKFEEVRGVQYSNTMWEPYSYLSDWGESIDPSEPSGGDYKDWWLTHGDTWRGKQGKRKRTQRLPGWATTK